MCCCEFGAGLHCSSLDARPPDANFFCKLHVQHRNADMPVQKHSPGKVLKVGSFGSSRLWLGASVATVLNQE